MPLARALWDFLKTHKKFWLALAFVVIVVLSISVLLWGPAPVGPVHLYGEIF